MGKLRKLFIRARNVSESSSTLLFPMRPTRPTARDHSTPNLLARSDLIFLTDASRLNDGGVEVGKYS